MHVILEGFFIVSLLIFFRCLFHNVDCFLRLKVYFACGSWNHGNLLAGNLHRPWDLLQFLKVQEFKVGI